MSTSDSLEIWNRALADIIDSPFDNGTLAKMITALEQIVQASSSTIMSYPPDHKPYIHFQNLLAEEDPSIHINQYLDGAYLVDPYYLASQENASEGVFTIKDVAPEGFENSEYYRLYYHAVDLLDEACFILQGIQGHVLVISLGRHTQDQYFQAEEKDLLQTLFPIVKAIVNKWAKESSALQHDEIIKTHLDAALKSFGTSLLTNRECEIINRILRGHSIKSISERLGNSIETIKHHRKKIYLKLEVNSQAELFYLFIDSLRCCSQEIDKDPLIAYMSTKS